MSQKYQNVKPKVRVNKKPLFHLQDKKADESELSSGLIKSAKRSGQLSLCNKGLGSVPENVWKLDELVLDEVKDVDFDRVDKSTWWNLEPLKMLDLSSNVIREISPNIKLLQDLNTLKLHDNAIVSLPSEIGEVKTLMNLSLDHNKLESLPKNFYLLTELRWLSISHNMLKQIQPEFGDLVMLTFLDLSHNQLTELPPGMGYLIRLVEINLSHNKLIELPPDIVNLRDLKKLTVTHNDLKGLPPMGELRKMEILDANHNNIEEFPDFFGCVALKEIYMANNYVTEITEEFCEQMQHLYVLNLRDNKLEKLPENFSLLQNLKRLDITNNNLKKLPRNMGLLSQLQSIKLEGNKLKDVRQDILRAGSDRMMKFIRDRVTEDLLDTPRSQDPEWPDKYTMRNTKGIVLTGRQISTVPDDLFKTAAQEEVYIVDLAKNKFVNVPAGITHMRDHLRQLILTSNCLSELSPAVAECTNLQYLELSKNSLTDLPIQLGSLKKLRELVISSNRFSKLPRCLYEMDNVEILLAADNKIEEINVSSDALGKLKNLAVLDLSNNNIVTVPPELGNFSQLRSLELTGNSFRQPRQAILAKGTASLLSYLRDRIPK